MARLQETAVVRTRAVGTATSRPVLDEEGVCAC